MADRRAAALDPVDFDPTRRQVVVQVVEAPERRTPGEAVSDDDWEAALAAVEAEDAPVVIEEPEPLGPILVSPKMVERSDKYVGDIEMAERAVQMQKLGLDPGFNNVQRQRMARIDEKVRALQSLVTGPQFATLIQGLRSNRGDIEATLDTMLKGAKSGTLFHRPSEPGPNTYGPNRSQRRGNKARRKRRR